jgi:hypothetical protein
MHPYRPDRPGRKFHVFGCPCPVIEVAEVVAIAAIVVAAVVLVNHVYDIYI